MRPKDFYGIMLNDILLAVLLLLISFLPLLYGFSGAGKKVVITFNDKKETYSLDKDTEFTVNNVRFKIEKGTIRAVSSSCTEQVCVHTGAISKSGSCIICAYNRVLAEIVEEGQTNVNAVAY